MDVYQFNNLIIVPTLKELGMYSKAANVLLLGTALTESRLVYVQQLGCGIAKGFYQMEPETAQDIWNNYLKYREDISDKVKSFLIDGQDINEQLMGNMYYATAMCRIHYRRVPTELPEWSDSYDMALYWKSHYNTFMGAGSISDAQVSFNRAIEVVLDPVLK